MQLDVIPIFLFQLYFLWTYCLRVIKFNHNIAIGATLAFVTASYFSRQYPHILNGSLMYAPAFCLIIILGGYHFHQRKHEPFLLINAAGVFATSLCFRTIDNIICPYLAIGSHFLWHILNGRLVYLAMKALLTNMPSNTNDLSH